MGDVAGFLTEHWGKRAHLRRDSGLAGLLSLEDADTIVSSMALRAPAFRVVKDGATLAPASWTRRARIGSRTVTDLIDVGRVYDHFAAGATIVLQGLHRYWTPVAELCQALEEELTHPLQANAYLTPPVAQGLRTHADAHDVFAVQTHGRKHWVVPAAELDVELEAGDCLYVPRGVEHAARTIDSASIHITLGVRTTTWADVVAGVLDDAVSAAGLDEPLPAGFAHDPDGLAAEAEKRLEALVAQLDEADPAAAIAHAAQRFWSQRQPSLRGQLQQVLAAEEIDDTTRVRRRPQTTCTLVCDDSTLEVVLVDRTLRMPPALEPALLRVAEAQELTPSELEDLLDEPGRITLVRRLVREGLLMVVHG